MVGGGGREAQEGGDVCILMADSCRQKSTQHCKAEGCLGGRSSKKQKESPQS